MKKYFSIVLVLVVTVICLSGCMCDLVIPESDLNSEATENGSSSPTQEDGVGAGKGTLKIYLTDALEKNDVHADYENIFISISRIEAHFVETDEEQLDAEDTSESKKGNWQVIAWWNEGEGFEVNLLELEGKSIFLASALLPSGKYTQLRVFLEDQAIIVVDGEEHELVIPSVGQTGIKLNHPFEITSDQITELTLDFDVDKSIIETGNGDYKLKPVIRIISSYSPDEGELYLGSIEGLVYNKFDGTEVIEGASVMIEGLILPYGETYLGTTETDSGGSYTISDVPFGVYKVTAIVAGYIESFRNIIIDSEEVITVDFELVPEESEGE